MTMNPHVVFVWSFRPCKNKPSLGSISPLVLLRSQAVFNVLLSAIFKAAAPLSLSAMMGFSVGVMDMQIGLNVSTRPSKGKYLHSQSETSLILLRWAA